MDNMICKGWEKIGLLKSFNEQFQLEAMEANAIKPLYSINFDFEIKQHEAMGANAIKPLFSINFDSKIKQHEEMMTTLIQRIPCLKSWNNV
jgi:hypothetical protein